jgi:Tfp pilus assembly protein PilF
MLAGMVLALAMQARAVEHCANCHPKEVLGYRQSAMAHSLSKPTPQPDGSFEHAFSKTRFSIQSGPSGVVQRFERGGTSSEQKIAFVIGSGVHAYGYLVQAGDHLFQSPLSYYSNRHQWDVAPGYEESRSPDFSRPVTLECLLCHAGKPQPIPDTLNRYQTPAFADESISCERCHGPGEAHERKPVAGSIINPAKLAGAVRDSICEQCHLAGEVRIPNPGKSIVDFQPGQLLEDTYTIYIAAEPAGETLKVISHSEQLALSVCARKSDGKLWCGTCHNPHEMPAQHGTQQQAAYFRDRCLSCHGATLEKSHTAPGRDCVACHMPRLPARDGGHTAFTDHRITRQPRQGSNANAEQPAALAAWREPEPRLRDRNFALALIAVGLQNESSREAVRGYRMLIQNEKDYSSDPAVLTSLGSVLLRAKQPAEALRRFESVLLLRPAYAPYEVNAAAALIAAGRKAESVRHLERALELDPLLQPAVELLRSVYTDLGEGAKAAELVARYKREMGYR